ncbi:MAG: hypothetical protein ABR569_11805 [Gaiellaceae bacterium]
MSAAVFVLHNLGPLWLVGMWAASVRWVLIDARARLASRSGIRVAVWAAALLPLVGVALWACARPAQTRLERRERRLRLLLRLMSSPPLAREPETPAPPATEDHLRLGRLAVAET